MYKQLQQKEIFVSSFLFFLLRKYVSYKKCSLAFKKRLLALNTKSIQLKDR